MCSVNPGSGMEENSFCLVRPWGEYDICREGRIYIFTGAKATGGFCVTRRGLLGAYPDGESGTGEICLAGRNSESLQRTAVWLVERVAGG